MRRPIGTRRVPSAQGKKFFQPMDVIQSILDVGIEHERLERRNRRIDSVDKAHLHQAEPILRDSRSRTRFSARAERAQPHLRDVGQRDTNTTEPVRYGHLDSRTACGQPRASFRR
jgi:hypothetical protein